VTCRCGSVGCWETEIGERAILARAGLPSDGGRQAVDGLLDDASHGDSAALAALDATGEWLGTGLAGLVNVFDPRVVVLGGVFGRMLPHVGPTIERRLERHALAASRALVRIVPAELGIDAPLIGAAELAFDPVLADPAARLGPRVERRTSRPAITRSPTRVAESSAKGVRAGRRRGTMRRDNPDRWIGPPATRRMVRLAGGEGGWT
jgi:hypothetical protein